jgi:hypothetical protein
MISKRVWRILKPPERVPPNGLAHLPLIIAKQLTLKIIVSPEWPPRTYTEGGQAEPVLCRLAS